MTNKKTLKSQLVGAVAMLLVATMALGGATFAWFTNNKIATAKGMTVQATADSSLVIKGSEDTNYTAIGTNKVSAETMKPASSSDGINFAVLGTNVKVDSAASSTATWSGTSGAFKEGDLTSGATKGTNYVESTYSIKSLAVDRDVKVSGITVKKADGTDADATFSKAMRVSVTLNNSTQVFNVGGGTNTDGKVAKYDSATSKFTLAADTSVYTANYTTKLASLTKDTAYDAVVRIWFEGQDTNCYTDNIAANGYSVVVQFEGMS